MHLYTAFLLSCLRMPAYTLEYKIGEQCDGRGVNDLKPIHPFGMLTASAVRYKLMPVTGIQIPVDGLKYTLRTTLVGIGKSAAAYLEGDTYVCQFVSVGKQ